MTSRDDDLHGTGRTSILSDLYIDLLGSLLPGLFTIVLSAVAIFPTVVVWWLLAASRNPDGTRPTDGALFNGTPDVWIGPYGTTAVTLVLAYILGSVLYRQDPKRPDWRSARRVWLKSSPEDRKRLAVQPASGVALDGTINADDAQFPYRFLYEYLNGRGLHHLAALIPWRGELPNSWNKRTKMFVNILKIRLQFLIPDRCKEIVRNEAHVRMATSVWYATHWVMTAVGLSLLCLTTITVYTSYKSLGTDWGPPGVVVFAINLTVLVFALVIKRKIEFFIHYLRVREIVYVLETAFFAISKGYELDMEDISTAKDAANVSSGSEADPST